MKTIFVSSTFKDMHFERDAIQEITLPVLRGEAAKYGESVSFCDLRWGINTVDLDSDAGARKVLDVCLDEIDRCKPPMVVILGDRYGWIPSEELTTRAADRKNLDKAQIKRDMELEDLQISVTALEIAYGALSTPEKRGQALFYFRHIESECPADYSVEDLEHKKKLDQLKARIHQLTGGRIQQYTVRWDGEKLDGVISFAEMLAEDIRKILLPEWKQKELLTPFERERLTHWAFITEKNAMFSARSALVQKYYDELTQKDNHFLAIKAPSGSGKSMLFSNLALKLRDGGYDVIPFMSGLTSESNDSIDILRNTIYYIEELLGFSHDRTEIGIDSIGNGANISDETQTEQKNGIDKLRERLFELCVECEQAGKHVIIMVDAVDQLASDDHRDNLVFIPERLSANVKFVMTCLPELAVAGRDFVTLKPINDDEKREVIEGILKSHNRELEDKVIRQMIKAKASSNPLFLSLLVQRLLMMNRDDFLAIKQAGDDMKAITEHQLEVIATCPDSLQGMSAALLTEAGKRINEELVRKVGEYLAVSRHGLRQEDLAALLGDKWSALDFAHFITYMNENFIQRDDGRFDFSHKCIREGFLHLCEDEISIHKQILRILKRLANTDNVKTTELAHHCIMADDRSCLLAYLNDIMSDAKISIIVASDIFRHCIHDRGAWMISLFSEEKNSNNLNGIFKLFNRYYYLFFSYDINCIKIIFDILSVSTSLLETLYKEDFNRNSATLLESYLAIAKTQEQIDHHVYFRTPEKYVDSDRKYYSKIVDIFEREAANHSYEKEYIFTIVDCYLTLTFNNRWASKVNYEYCSKAFDLTSFLAQDDSGYDVLSRLCLCCLYLYRYYSYQCTSPELQQKFKSEAETLLDRLFSQVEQLDLVSLKQLAKCWLYYIKTFYWKSNKAGAQAAIERLVFLCERIYRQEKNNENNRVLSDAYYLLGFVNGLNGEYMVAFIYMQKAIECRLPIYQASASKSDLARILTCYHNLYHPGYMHKGLQTYPEASSYYEMALKLVINAIHQQADAELIHILVGCLSIVSSDEVDISRNDGIDFYPPQYVKEFLGGTVSFFNKILARENPEKAEKIKHLNSNILNYLIKYQKR